MSDDLNLRLATLTALLELNEALSKDDLKAAQDCRDKRLILALDLFSCAQRIRRDNEQTTSPEPHTGPQGEGGACGHQGRSNAGSAGGAVRRPSQSDHLV